MSATKSLTFRRRIFLRGAAGAIVGLPLLESLGGRDARGAAPTAFRYAIFMRQANGVQQKSGTEPESFWPTATGPLTKASLQADAAAGRTLGTLADYADKLNVVRGLKYAYSTTGCGHADGGLQCLTAAKPDGKNGNLALAMGESIDNRIVRELEPAGSEPLNLYAGHKDGFLDDVLSYRGPKDRRAAEQNPFNAYKRLFGLPTTDPQQAQLALQRKSVNDLVRGQMQALMGRAVLSKSDKDRLQLHFEAIRDLETTMACQLPSTRYGQIAAVNPGTLSSDDQIENTIGMQQDVIALAMSCGRSHAATLQIGNGNDQTQFVINGVKQERYHRISHRVDSDGATGTAIVDAVSKHHQIDLKFAGFYKALLDKLSAYKTPTGTLLDDGIAIWFNDLADGPPHGSNNVPWICAGGAGGALRTGQYLDAGQGAGKLVTNNKILNTIGAAVGVKNAAGAPLDDFGDPALEKGLITALLA
jgi:Protein of unknown function (DUF1552)